MPGRIISVLTAVVEGVKAKVAASIAERPRRARAAAKKVTEMSKSSGSARKVSTEAVGRQAQEAEATRAGEGKEGAEEGACQGDDEGDSGG